MPRRLECRCSYSNHSHLMGSKFIPSGYLKFDAAWRLVASLKYGADLAPYLTPYESIAYASYSSRGRRAENGEMQSKVEPTARHIGLLEKKLKRYDKQRGTAQNELRQ